ncbi:MAG: hypothetical protein LBQ92_05550 [Propionibacteriaceae bacterium]|jgi:predicted ribosomally synthesized peptide with SipW-like signal peptide|nr:hypothetical protein [Propionibacteriaceae bacterium]
MKKLALLLAVLLGAAIGTGGTLALWSDATSVAGITTGYQVPSAQLLGADDSLIDLASDDDTALQFSFTSEDESDYLPDALQMYVQDFANGEAKAAWLFQLQFDAYGTVGMRYSVRLPRVLNSGDYWSEDLRLFKVDTTDERVAEASCTAGSDAIPASQPTLEESYPVFTDSFAQTKSQTHYWCLYAEYHAPSYTNTATATVDVFDSDSDFTQTDTWTGYFPADTAQEPTRTFTFNVEPFNGSTT